jgi:hypothetical protein
LAACREFRRRIGTSLWSFICGCPPYFVTHSLLVSLTLKIVTGIGLDLPPLSHLLPLVPRLDNPPKDLRRSFRITESPSCAGGEDTVECVGTQPGQRHAKIWIVLFDHSGPRGISTNRLWLA